jgi:hypothetical protein
MQMPILDSAVSTRQRLSQANADNSSLGQLFWRDAWTVNGLGYLLASVFSGFGIGAVALWLGLGFLGEGLLKPITMALIRELTDEAYLARVLAAEQGLSAVVQSVAAVVIAACVTDVPATVLWVSAATGGLLIGIALCVRVRASAVDPASR